LVKSSDILVIQSSKEELKRAEDFLHGFFDEHEIPLDMFNRVYLCLSEAVLNSIQHGNRKDHDKHVYIKTRCADGSLFLEVQDEGKGFDYSHLENPTKRNNIKKESGRGIHIIKSLSDGIEFLRHGTCIRFKIFY